MNKRLFTIVMVVTLFVVTALVATPAYAYGGVEGQAIDLNGNGWTHGGTVTVYEQGNNTPIATGSLDANGNFSVAYTGTPALFSNMYLVLDFNYGGVSDPGDKVIEYIELPGSDYYNAGFVSTGTGPNAITLRGVEASGSIVTTPAIFAFALILLAAATLILLRRRAHA